jgi:hypothetical protein
VNSSQNTSGASNSLNAGSKLISFNKLKNILGASASPRSISKKSPTNKNYFQTSTGVTYRLIASIPRLITEVENRENLAIKAALMIAQQEELAASKDNNNSDDDLNTNNGHGLSKLCLENPISIFEQYAKTIEAVDSILKRDRLQQQSLVKKLVQEELNKSVGNNSADENSESVAPKTIYNNVPDLIKSVSKLNYSEFDQFECF